MHDAFAAFIRSPARVHEQFAAELLKCFSQQRVHRVPRKAKRGRGQLANRRPVCSANKHHRAGMNGAGLFKARKQSEPFEDGLSISADEFTANPVPRILARLPNCDGNCALPQADAQGQSRQPAANDRDGFARRHFSILPPRDEQVAERVNGAFDQLPILFVRPERRKFAARKAGADADMAIVAGDRTAADHPQQATAKPWQPRAARFERDDHARGSRRQPKQFGERLRLKLVEKQIADNGSRWVWRRPPQPFGGFSDFRVDTPAKALELIARLRINRVQPVHECHLRTRPSSLQTPGNTQKKMSIASAQLDNVTGVLIR